MCIYMYSYGSIGNNLACRAPIACTASTATEGCHPETTVRACVAQSACIDERQAMARVARSEHYELQAMARDARVAQSAR